MAWVSGASGSFRRTLLFQQTIKITQKWHGSETALQVVLADFGKCQFV